MSEEDVVEDQVDSDMSEVEEPSTEGEPVEQNQPEEIVDPLEEALQRADFAEKEIVYKEAEIQNLRKRFLSEKSELIKYSSQGLARRIIPILADVERAVSSIEEGDESPVAQGLRMMHHKLLKELEEDGVKRIETKGQKFDPKCMEAITTIPASDAFPADQVVDELEAGYMYKDRVLQAARVVVASE